MTGATPASPKRSAWRLPRRRSGPPRLRSDRASRRAKATSTHGFARRCRPPDKCSLDDESAHARSAADIERLAGHEAIGPVAEEYHGPRVIVAAAQSLHRNGRRQRLLAFAVLR